MFFPIFKLVKLFIKITPPIIEVDCGAKFFEKTCSASSFLLKGSEGIQ